MNQENSNEMQEIPIKNSKMLNSRVLNSKMLNSRKKKKNKLQQYETNFQNYQKNQQFSMQLIDAKGISSNGIYASFSGIISSAQMFYKNDITLQISYQIITGKQWYDQTYQITDMKGQSSFCNTNNGNVIFGLSFDCLLSCMYIQSWPQLVMKIKGFDSNGNIVHKGYAQLNLPIYTGQAIKNAYIYGIIKNKQWYYKFLPFTQPIIADYDDKDFQQIIVQGCSRQLQKIISIGKITINTQTLLRNYSKFGYK